MPPSQSSALKLQLPGVVTSPRKDVGSMLDFGRIVILYSKFQLVIARIFLVKSGTFNLKHIESEQTSPAPGKEEDLLNVLTKAVLSRRNSMKSANPPGLFNRKECSYLT